MPILARIVYDLARALIAILCWFAEGVDLLFRSREYKELVESVDELIDMEGEE